MASPDPFEAYRRKYGKTPSATDPFEAYRQKFGVPTPEGSKADPYDLPAAVVQPPDIPTPAPAQAAAAPPSRFPAPERPDAPGPTSPILDTLTVDLPNVGKDSTEVLMQRDAERARGEAGLPPILDEPEIEAPTAPSSPMLQTLQPQMAPLAAEEALPHPEAESVSLLEEAQRAAGRGVGRMVESAGGMLQAVSGMGVTSPVRTEFIRGRGRSIEEAGTELVERPEVARSPELEAADPFLDGGWKDPRWWVGNGGEIAPQIIAQFGLAIASGGMSTPARLALFAAPTIVQESGGAYTEVRDGLLAAGADPQEAAARAESAALLTGLGAYALEQIPGSVILLGKIPGADAVFNKAIGKAVTQMATGSRAGRAGAGAFAESFSEGAQEAWADVVQYAATEDPAAFQDWQNRYAGSAALGGVAGAGFGVAYPEQSAPEPSVRVADPEMAVQQAREEGAQEAIQAVAPEVDAARQQGAEEAIQAVQPVIEQTRAQAEAETLQAVAPVIEQARQEAEAEAVAAALPAVDEQAQAAAIAQQETDAARMEAAEIATAAAEAIETQPAAERLEPSVQTLPLDELSRYADPNVPLDKLREQERGYLDNLKEDVRRDGVLHPIDVKIRTDGSRVIWDGMHRLAVAQELGLESLPVRYVDSKGQPIEGPRATSEPDSSRNQRIAPPDNPEPPGAPETPDAVVPEVDVDPDPPPWRTRSVEGPTGREADSYLPGDESSVRTRYRVVEADELVPSHNAQSFEMQPVDRYPAEIQGRAYHGERGRAAREEVMRQTSRLKPDLLLDATVSVDGGPPLITPGGVVVAGNQRTMLLQRSAGASSVRYQDYLEGLKKRAQEFGLSRRALVGMRHPVLVRELNQLSDTPKGKTKDALSSGATRAAALRGSGALDHLNETLAPDQTVTAYLETGPGRAFARSLVESGVITTNERARYIDATTGAVTAEGRQEIKRMLQAAAIGDADVIQRAPADAINRIEHAIPAIVRAGAAEGWDLGPQLRGALDLLASVRASEFKTVDEYLGQGSMFGEQPDPKAAQMARFLESSTKPGVSAAARSYAADADAFQRQSASEDLFGHEPRTASQAFAEHFGSTTAAPEPAVQADPDPDAAEGAAAEPPATEDTVDEPEVGLPALRDPSRLPTRARTRRPADPLKPLKAAQPIAERLTGQLETPPKPQKGKSVSRPQVMHSFGEILQTAGKEVPIRVGRLGMKRARGWFNVQTEVIRINSADNLPTAAHEVGHALEKLIFGWPKGGPWVSPRVDRAIQKELLKMGKALYGNETPVGGYKREGWAEFMRFYLMTDEAQTQAPKLHAWFDGTFSEEFPDIRKALDRSRALATRWREQGSQERAHQSIVDPASPKERLKRGADKVQKWFSMEQHVEMAEPLAKLARAAEAPKGEALTPANDPFFTISALRTTQASRTRQMVESAMIDLAGNKVGPGLVEIRELVKGKRKDFTVYLWARRALRMWNDPQGARNPGLSRQDAQQIIDELDSVKFQLAAGKVYEWNDGVLNYAAQASPSFRQVVEKVRERDPGDYIPLLREFEELDAAWSGMGGSASARRGSPVKRLKGSGRRIKDPFPAMISKAEQTIRAAHERMVLDQIIKLSRVEGLGHLVEEVAVDKAPVATVSIDELINKIESELFGSLGKAGSVEVNNPFNLPIDLVGQTLTFFAPVQRPDGKAPIIPIWEGGRVRWYEVDGDLYRTLASLDVYRLGDVGELLLGKSAAMFRAGTTGLRASFGLFWNMARDVQSLHMHTQTSANNFQLFGAWLQSMAEALLHKTTGKRSQYMDLFIRLGGEMAQPLGQDMNHTRRASRRLFEGRAVRTLDPRNWYDFYRDLVQFPESAARMAEMRLLAKEIGWSPGQPMTLSQSMQLLLAGKQVTTDFTAAGEFARVMNRIAPFYNSAIQGPRASVRAAKRTPKTFVARGLQLTALSLALWWEQKDEEWYIQMDYREKFSNWHFPFTWNGKEELLRLPGAFEIHAIFSALPVTLIDAAYRQEPEKVKEWFTTFIDVSKPNVMPVLAAVAAEQLANKDFFFDTPIVPRGEQMRPAEEQFNEYTTTAAIALGDLFNASPRRIDHAIDGLFGPVGGDLLSLLGFGEPGRKKQGELADLPIVGRGFQRGGRLGNYPKSVDELFEALDAAKKRQYSTRNPETELERQHRLQLEDATQAIIALMHVRSQTARLDVSRRISAEVASISTRALQADQEGRLARDQFKGERRVAEGLEELLKGKTEASATTKK